MSYYGYRVSQDIWMRDYPFYALIMAAMRQADTGNRELLKEAFPATWTELYARYHAPGGYLENEIPRDHGETGPRTTSLGISTALMGGRSPVSEPLTPDVHRAQPDEPKGTVS